MTATTVEIGENLSLLLFSSLSLATVAFICWLASKD